MTAQYNDYTEIIKETIKMISLVKTKGDPKDKHKIAELYGIYYNAFAGALRAGILYSKEMDVDGYPKYVISIGNNMYPCKDIALRNILGDDYEKITQAPYDDTSASYVIHYSPLRPSLPDEYAETIIAPTLSQKEDGTFKAEQRKEEALIRAKNKELLRDARGFQYDPDYDHFYSDRLPDLLKELDSTLPVIGARIASICLCFIGIILSLSFL